MMWYDKHMDNKLGDAFFSGGAVASERVFGQSNEIEEREIEDSFTDALGRDRTSIKKEMGEEGLKEIQRIVKKYENDPYMLNVKIQDMSDTLILEAFGRVRNGTETGK